MYHHRSGTLKQDNKKNKRGQHASKRAVDRRINGRVESGGGSRRASRASVKSLASMSSNGKKRRQEAAKQHRNAKKLELMRRRRKFGGEGAPKIIGILPLSAASNLDEVRKVICTQSQEVATTGSGAMVGSPLTLSFAAQRQRMTIISPADNDLMRCLAVARAADVVVFVANMADGVEDCTDEEGYTLLTAIKAQGLPSVVGVFQGTGGLPKKQQNEARKYANRLFTTEFGPRVKMADMDNAVQLVRALTTVQPKALSWRNQRPYMVVLGAESSATAADGTVTLKVGGFMRGGACNVKRLVHISEVGTFQLNKITRPADPFPLLKGSTSSTSEGVVTKVIEFEGDVVGAADAAAREDVRCMADFNALSAEQTWPTDQEMKEAAIAQAKLIAASDKMVMRVPKGTSSYQAAWLADSDEEVDFVPGATIAEEDEEGGVDLSALGAGAGMGAGSGDMDSDDASVGAATDGSGGSDMSDDMEEDELALRQRLEADDLTFPNEVTTPRDVAAHERFARYRGLKSFRATPWNPKWNLPRSYARSYQFKNFTRTQNRVLSNEKQVHKALDHAALQKVLKARKDKRRGRKQAKAAVPDGTPAEAGMEVDMDAGSGDDETMSGVDTRAAGYVPSGEFVVMHIEKVPVAALAARGTTTPMIVSGLLTHENRMSVVHFNLSRVDTYDVPIKSKDRFEFQVGWRHFDGAPIFSQNNINCDKHKFERFFSLGRHSVASLFAPVCYGPMNILMFTHTEEGRKLVATGTLLEVNPDRVILKEVMLTGYPIKVKNKFAVVKYMFFRADDVRYFKSIELRTKYGLHGHIRQPLGTHGLMKCVFDKYIRNNDTVCMSLYKRIFPKLPDVEIEDMQFTTATPLTDP